VVLAGIAPTWYGLGMATNDTPAEVLAKLYAAEDDAAASLAERMGFSEADLLALRKGEDLDAYYAATRANR